MSNDFLLESRAMKQIGCNPHLPEDIIRIILKRLPVTSLIRFQCVCNGWKNLLKTPSFIAEHLHHSRNANPLLLLQWDHKFDPFHFHMLNHKMQLIEFQPPLPLVDSSLRTEIVGCSNGLLCVRYYDFKTSLSSLLVWNPATRETRQVPSPIKIKLVIDFCELGFGFSPIDNEYKILVAQVIEIDSLFYPIEAYSLSTEVYSLSTGSWKEIKFENSGGLCVTYVFPITTVNGAMFYIVDKANDSIVNGAMNMGENDPNVTDLVIVSFDMATEVFTLIPLPCDDGGLCERFLNVYEDKLAMLSCNVIENWTDLWVMDEGARSSGERWGWSKKYSISTSPIIYPRGIWLDEIVCLPIDLCAYDEFEIETDSETETDDRTIDALYMLNLSTREWVHFDCRQRGSQGSLTFNYTESLVPVANVHP